MGVINELAKTLKDNAALKIQIGGYTDSAKLPANVLNEGSCPAMESSILFSFETDFTGRVKAGPQIETWQGRSAAAFTPAVILFIALPEAKDNIDPG